MLVECKMDGSLSRRERKEIVTLARRRLGAEAVLAHRNGVGLVFKRISIQNARHDSVLPLGSFDAATGRT